MKLEDAPNKMVHADDLAEALAKLRHQAGGTVSPVSPVDSTMAGVEEKQPASSRGSRSRSATLIFHPSEHGASPELPCIAVDDFADEPEEDMTDSPSPVLASQPKPIMAHTARPPVELMNE